MAKATPKKWTEVYPYGTQGGDEEASFFKAIARRKMDFSSTAQIVKATGLSQQRVEEIIDKYVNKVKPALIYAHPTQEDHWGYWERCPDRLEEEKRDIARKDKDLRVDKHLGGCPDQIGAPIQTDPNDDISAVDLIDGFSYDFGASKSSDWVLDV
jgi:hypothetical protein